MTDNHSAENILAKFQVRRSPVDPQQVEESISRAREFGDRARQYQAELDELSDLIDSLEIEI